MKSITTNTDNKAHIQRVYAVTTGDYVGETYICVDDSSDPLKFLSIPKNINRYVPQDKFDFAMNYDIIEYIETLPTEVYEIVKAQFLFNENSNH